MKSLQALKTTLKHKLGPRRCENGSSSGHFPLLQLTASIRNMIWELVIIREERILCPCAFPALLHTCSQIREETKRMFVGRNKFIMTPDMDKHLKRKLKRPALESWLRTVDNMAALDFLFDVDVARGFCDGLDGHLAKIPEGKNGDFTMLRSRRNNLGHLSISTTVLRRTAQEFKGPQLGWIAKACLYSCALLIFEQRYLNAPDSSLSMWMALLATMKRLHDMENSPETTWTLCHEIDGYKARARRLVEMQHGDQHTPTDTGSQLEGGTLDKEAKADAERFWKTEVKNVANCIVVHMYPCDPRNCGSSD